MSDLIYIGKDVQSFQKAARLAGYDRVVLNLDDNNYIASPCVSVSDKTKWESRAAGEYIFTWWVAGERWRTPFSTVANTAALKSNYGLDVYYSNVTSPKDGDTITVQKVVVDDDYTITAELTRSGSTLTADCPLVKPSNRKAVADNLLKQVYGFEYQPFTADGAYMNPAAEIGDAITAYGIYAGLFDQEITFNRLFLSKIGSAISKEAEAEMQYDNAADRKYTRRLAETAAEFAILADRISAAVSDAEFQAALETMSNQISAKVSSTGGNSSSFSWSLTANGFVLYANGSKVFECNRNGITVTGDGTFTGNIYASNIKSTAIDGYGGSFHGGGITGGTVAAGTCTNGVQASLGYADYSNSVFNSGTRCGYMYTNYLEAGRTAKLEALSATTLAVYYGGAYYSATFQIPSVSLNMASAFQVKDTNGQTRWVSNVGSANLGSYVLTH